jgi:hypothetical protein
MSGEVQVAVVSQRAADHLLAAGREVERGGGAGRAHRQDGRRLVTRCREAWQSGEAEVARHGGGDLAGA